MGRPPKRKYELINILEQNNCKLISVEDRNVSYEDEFGYKYKKDFYKIINNNGNNLDKHKIRESNPYAIDNIKLMTLDNNQFNSIPLFVKKEILTFKCGKCNSVVTKRAKDYIRSQFKLCSDCYASLHFSPRKHDINVVFDDINKMGYKVLSEKYIDAHYPIDIEDSDGYKGNICYQNLLKGSTISKFAKYNKFALDNIRHFCKLNNFDCEIPKQDYLGWDLPIKVVCKCGETFYPTSTHLILDSQYQCVKCSGSQSNNEKIIENYLKSINIIFETQKKFDDCVYKKELPFDFYLPNMNICIEVDGEGHYKPTNFHGIDDSRANDLFEMTKLRDEIKNKYCEDNGITLIRISYIDIKNNNYKNILSLYNIQ